MTAGAKHPMGMMTYQELDVYLTGQKRLIVIALGAVTAWSMGAGDALAKGVQVRGLTNQELKEIVAGRGGLLGIPTSYMVHSVTAALDAYLKTYCIRKFKHLPADSSWFSLDAVEMVTCIPLRSFQQYPRIQKLYEAREVLRNLEFGLEWSVDEVASLIEDAGRFAKDFRDAMHEMWGI